MSPKRPLTKGVSSTPSTLLLPTPQPDAPQRVGRRQTILGRQEEKMKIPLVLALAGLEISLALPTFAQQSNTDFFCRLVAEVSPPLTRCSRGDGIICNSSTGEFLEQVPDDVGKIAEARF